MPQANVDTIKEYLVKLGFGIDENSYNKTIGIIGTFSGTIKKIANPATGIIALSGAFAGIMKSAAAADMATEKFAHKMWMSEQNARGLTTALDAMGESIDSINDVAISPELRSHFFQLRKDAAQYENADVDAAMRRIRDFQFEFQRLKVFMTNASRYVAYYLEKYLAKPMAQIRAIVKSINDRGVELANKWGKRIAIFAQGVANVATSVIRLIKSFVGLLEELPNKVKLIAVGVAAGFAIMLSPWLMMAAAITSVLLLVEDYYAYKDGKESLFGDLWEKLDKLKPVLEEIKDDLAAAWEKIEPFINLENAKQLGALVAYLWSFHKVMKAISIIQGFSGISKFVGHISKLVSLGEKLAPMLKMGGVFSAIAAFLAALGYISYSQYKEDPEGFTQQRIQYEADNEGYDLSIGNKNANNNSQTANNPQTTLGIPYMANAPGNTTTTTTNNTNNSKKVTNNYNSNPTIHQSIYINGATNPTTTANAVVNQTNQAVASYSRRPLNLNFNADELGET